MSKTDEQARGARRAVRAGAMIVALGVVLLIGAIFLSSGSRSNKYVVATGFMGLIVACIGISMIIHAALDWLRSRR